MSNNSHAVAIDDGPIDGRTARRDRNKTAVLDAVIELFAEGTLTPGVHDVARRSGVSLRSVYRYFEDVEDLVAAAIARHLERFGQLFEMPDPGVGALGERIERFCRRRLALFSSVRPVFKAAAIRACDHPQLARSILDREHMLRRQTSAMFSPELDALDAHRAAVVRSVLDSLSQFESLEYHFRRHDEDVEETTQFLIHAFAEVLVERS